MKTRARHTLWLLIGCSIQLFLGAACVKTTTWEVDTSAAKDFQWDGRILITERTTDEIGAFLSVEKSTAAHSFELVGRDGRNIVVRPTGHAACEHPVARVESRDDVGKPVLQLLAMALKPSCPMLAQAVEKAASSQPSEPAQSSAQDAASREEARRLLLLHQKLRDGQYNELTTANAVAAAATMNNASYTVFDLGDGKSLKAWLDNTSPPSLVATVYDRDGKALHEYRPVDLSVEKAAPPP